MTSPLVSVITSTFNYPEALTEAIKSVLQQSFKDFEYLILGDCCTDDTESVVRKFDDPRISWHNLPTNTGNQSGVNRIANDLARGRYIAYLNHDDIWFPDHLKDLVSFITSKNLDIVNSLCLVVPPDNHHNRNLQGIPYYNPQVGRHALTAVTSTVLHCKYAGMAVGGWRDWRESSGIPTLDFFLRVLKLRQRYSVLLKCSSLKFNSADRPGCYVTKDASEQRSWTSRMTTDQNLREKEVLAAYACLYLGDLAPGLQMPKKPTDSPDGWEIEQYRRVRGLEPRLSVKSAASYQHPGQPNYNFGHIEDGSDYLSFSQNVR